MGTIPISLTLFCACVTLISATNEDGRAMDQHLPSLLLSAHALAAGLTFQLAATQLFRWRCRREDAAAFRLGLVASSLTAVLLVNTWLLQAPPTQVDAALFLRSVLFLVTIVLLVPTVATFVDRPAPRAGLRLLAVLCVIRLALWVSTDLVSQHAVDADGAPRYGSLVAVTSVPLVALLVLLVVRLARHWHDTVERAAFFAGLIASMAILLLSLAVRDGPLAELLTGLLVLPLVVGLQVIAARRTAQTEHASQLAAAQRRAVSEELARSERRSTLALLAGGMGWYEWDPQTRALAASPEFAQILGVAPEQIPATIDKLLEYVHPEDRRGIGVAIDGTPMIGHEAEDFRVVRPDGAVLWIEANGRTVTGQDGQVEVLGVVRDITERKRAEEELTHLATHDPLTGLANRPALTKCVGEHLERDEPFALLLMDLNGFKDVNDTLGHPVGDEVLVAVARRLETTLRASDVLTRIDALEAAEASSTGRYADHPTVVFQGGVGFHEVSGRNR